MCQATPYACCIIRVFKVPVPLFSSKLEHQQRFLSPRFDGGGGHHLDWGGNAEKPPSVPRRLAVDRWTAASSDEDSSANSRLPDRHMFDT